MLNNVEESPIFRDTHALNPISPLSASENFNTISREFNALVLAGSMLRSESPDNLDIIEEGRRLNEETDSLGVVVDRGRDGVTIKKEETETNINAWENVKIGKINNRFKRDGVIIRGWVEKQVHNATSWIKRKWEEIRAKAVEKMRNDMLKARRKAEKRKSSAYAKRRTKVTKIMEIANFMRAMGRAPSKCCFWK